MRTLRLDLGQHCEVLGPVLGEHCVGDMRMLAKFKGNAESKLSNMLERAAFERKHCDKKPVDISLSPGAKSPSRTVAMSIYEVIVSPQIKRMAQQASLDNEIEELSDAMRLVVRMAIDRPSKPQNLGT